MNVNQKPSQLTLHGNGNGLTVDTRAATSIRTDGAGDHQLALLTEEAHPLDRCHRRGIQLGKNGRHGSTALTGSDQFAGNTISQKQVDRIQNDRLTRTRFTAEDGKSLPQVQIQPLDDGNIFNMQALQHGGTPPAQMFLIGQIKDF